MSLLHAPLRARLTGIGEHLKLLIRFNTKTRCVEMKASPHTTEASALQKGEDFVRAFILGFDIR